MIVLLTCGHLRASCLNSIWDIHSLLVKMKVNNWLA